MKPFYRSISRCQLKISYELRHIDRSMGLAIPFLPVHGVDEVKLFCTLVLEMPVFDESAMAIKWCSHVNGTTIFPKLPVYLRLHVTKWEHYQRVRDALKSVMGGTVLLEEVNNYHTIPVQGPIPIHTPIQRTVQGATTVPTIQQNKCLRVPQIRTCSANDGAKC
jgi:hypothetical protein